MRSCSASNACATRSATGAAATLAVSSTVPASHLVVAPSASGTGSQPWSTAVTTDYVCSHTHSDLSAGELSPPASAPRPPAVCHAVEEPHATSSGWMRRNSAQHGGGDLADL